MRVRFVFEATPVEDEIEIPDAEIEGMTENQLDAYLDKQLTDWVLNYNQEYYYEIIKEG